MRLVARLLALAAAFCTRSASLLTPITINAVLPSPSVSPSSRRQRRSRKRRRRGTSVCCPLRTFPVSGLSCARSAASGSKCREPSAGGGNRLTRSGRGRCVRDRSASRRPHTLAPAPPSPAPRGKLGPHPHGPHCLRQHRVGQAAH